MERTLSCSDPAFLGYASDVYLKDEGNGSVLGNLIQETARYFFNIFKKWGNATPLTGWAISPWLAAV